jgi:two-component system cell cycle sensor histidine kinase/response regulator CckA
MLIAETHTGQATRQHCTSNRPQWLSIRKHGLLLHFGLKNGVAVMHCDGGPGELSGFLPDAQTTPLYDRCLSAISPEFRELTVSALHSALSDGSPIQLEILLEDQGQPERWVRLVLVPGDPATGSVAVTLFDITHETHTCGQAHHNATRLELAIEAAEDAVWDWNLVTNHPYFSDRYYSMLGYAPNEFPASYESWRSLVHPDDIESAELILGEHFANQRETYIAEFRMRQKSGFYVWIQARGRVVAWDSDGRATRMVGVHTDISSQKLAEQSIRESEHAYRAMFDQSPFTVTLRRLNGPYVDVNRQMLTASRLQRSEIIGKTPLELGLYDPETNRQFNEILARDGGMSNFEIVSLIGGSHRNLLMSARVIDINGEPHVLTVGNDITERKNVERALRELEDRTRSLVASIPIGMHVYRLNSDGALIFTDFNPAAESILVADHREFVGKPIEEAFPALVETGIPERYKEVVRTGQSWNSEQFHYNDGAIAGAFELHAFATGVDSMAVAFADVTERKQAEMQLADSQRQLKGLTDNLPGVIYQFELKPDRTHKLRFISGKVEQILGFSKDQPDLIASLISRIDPRDIEQFRHSLYKSLSSLSQWQFEGRYVRENGDISWFKMLSTPHLENDVVVFDGIMLDVTDLLEAQQQLRNSETMLTAVIETIPGRVFWKNHNLHYLGCNSAFARDAGMERPADLAGKMDFDVAWKDQAELYRTDDLKVMETGIGRLNFEEPQTTPEGNTIWLRTSKVPLRSASGEIIGVLGTYDDITENKKMEDQLARAEKMQALGLLAGGVAHDLNNTLGPLVGYPELMLRQLPEGSPLRKMVLRIERAAIDAVDVIQDLLTLARRGRYEMKPISLNDVVATYLDSSHYLRISSERPGIKVTTDLTTNLPLIQGSTAHLSKVIMNLVGNAFEAMEEPASLTIATQTVALSRLESGVTIPAPGLYNLLRIRDTGCGIAREDLHKIFEPYFSRKSMGRSGTGLGLAVVYGVIKDHKGYYDVFSEVGKGTEFVFYFPVSTEEAEAVEQEVKNEQAVRGKILVVDDSVEQRELAHQLIAGLGYEVDAVTNGHEALKYLAGNHVDIVVLDMVMEKDFDGLSTYEAMLKMRPEQRAVIVSGFSDMERVHKMQALGAGPFVRKPYTMKVIGEALSETLRKPH